MFEFIIFWIICMILVYGFSLAHLQKEYIYIAWDYRDRDVIFSFFLSLFGPAALLVILLDTRFKHGWRLFPLSEEEIIVFKKRSS